MTTPDYVPIACDLYSELEVLADRRVEVVADSVTPAGVLEQVRGRVLDLVIRDGAEYLVLAREAGEPLALRLDRLRSLVRPGGEALWRQDPGAGEERMQGSE